MNILVIHVNTTYMRGVVFNESSDILFETEESYMPQHLAPGIREQNPLEWLNALVDTSRRCMEYLDMRGEQIEALVLTSMRSSVIPVDEEGKALRNAIMWRDRRNAEYLEALSPKTGRLYELTGSVPNTVFSGTKMRWIMDHEPDVYKHTYKFCTVAEYLIHAITGEFKTDYTYGSRSLLMNIGNFSWDDELLDIIGIEREKLCDIIPPGSIVGFVTGAFSKISGIPAGIPVITAGGDQQCSALGGGVLEKEATEITVGPGGYVFSCSEKRPDDTSGGVLCSAHAIPGRYVLEASMLDSDDFYRWMNQLLFGEDHVPPKSFVKIDHIVEETPVGSHGVTAIPYLTGRGTPDWNMGAFGGFLYVTPATTKGDMARSVLESIACEMTNLLEVLGRYETLPKEIFLGGHLVHSKAFCQMLADASGIVMKRNITPIAQTPFGAFIVAAVSLGIYGSYEEAYFRGKQHFRYKTFEPVQENAAIYTELRARINELYRRLSDYPGKFD